MIAAADKGIPNIAGFLVHRKVSDVAGVVPVRFKKIEIGIVRVLVTIEPESRQGRGTWIQCMANQFFRLLEGYGSGRRDTLRHASARYQQTKKENDTNCSTQVPASPHHTLHTLSAAFTIGWPGLHENAVPNSGTFTTTPLMRYFAGEWGSVIARARRSSGRSLAHAHCAKPTKNRWSGVKPSRFVSCLSLSAFFHAM